MQQQQTQHIDVNTVMVSGRLRSLPTQVKEGSEYYRTQINSVDEAYGRDTVIEFTHKAGEWMQGAHIGGMIVVRGNLSGRFSQQGYYNLGMFAREIRLVGTLQLAAASQDAPFDGGEEGDISF
ncbi:hypothetical protein UFOVP142_59 [uncultured Caudovirales phage]|uniref:Uncharacterized protein n=1 Tax=uncultured Caudovirales phage TaxID=2100421 RepID=A0A6J7XUJ7_9CAUD|nr:hypothetical protein UFOVP142_59 [uncultured Caudovirales phage]